MPRDRVLERVLALPAEERKLLSLKVEASCRRLKLFYRIREDRPPLVHPLALNPLLLEPGFMPAVSALTRAVFRFQRRLPALIRAGHPGLERVCALEPEARQWLEVIPASTLPGPLLIRLDFGLTRGSPVLFETNATALAGFHYHPAAVSVLREVVLPRLGLASELKDPPDLRRFLCRWILRAGGPNVAVGFVEDPPFGPGDTEMPQLARALRTSGVCAAWGAPGEVRKTRGGFRLRGQDINWLYRDIAFKELPSPETPSLRNFRELVCSGRAGPGFAAEFDHKAMLECFSSEEFARFFLKEELRQFSRMVPWTRLVTARKTTGPDGRILELPDGLMRRPERWLLKPNRDCGGAGIVLGSRSGVVEWGRALARAAGEPGGWVVQEWRETLRRPMLLLNSGKLAQENCYSAVGVFCGERERGVYARVSPGPVVNVAQGGALAAVFFA